MVNKDVPDYALMVGVPARQIAWMNEYGEQLDIPLTGDAQTKCPYSGTTYYLNNNTLNKAS